MRFFRRAPKVEDEAMPATVETADAEQLSAEAQQLAAEAQQLAAEDEERTEQALARTKKSWFGNISSIFSRGDVDEELWEELEELLIGADAGVATTERILDEVRERVDKEHIKSAEEVEEVLKQTLVDLLRSPEGKGRLWTENGSGEAPPKPAVILVLGVNGTGKTTTIAKLAHAYRAEGGSTIIAAADTFRAAAIEQLKAWGDRVGADVISHKQGADPAAVVFDALSAAESRNADAVIIDTAGRLHTKVNLMEELSKLRRIIERKQPDAPHEVLLVLDATIGQNALLQAEAFTKAAKVTSVCLTKLDGTSKGGIVFAIADQMGIPVRLVGTGEEPEDLAPFSPEAFVEALFR